MKKILLFLLLSPILVLGQVQYGPLPQGSTTTKGTDNAVKVRPVPQTIVRTSFASVLASSWDATFWTSIITGTGQAISQSAGNGVITSGTTANSEVILRSTNSFTGSFILREQTTLSQRITNNNFYIELVDVIGDALAITVNSATSVTVTIPSNPFTSVNVGQSMYIGAATGFTGVTAVPGRYAIASVSGNNVTFTVASWATGSQNTGTCSLFGWNYHQLLYTGASPTALNYDAQRRGWNSGATTATINSSVVGHMAIMGSEDGNAYLADQLVASTAILPITIRASRVLNLAEEVTPLYLQIRSANGTTNPATTTTWTIGMISVENYATTPVAITTSKAQGPNTAQLVNLMGGTVTTVNTVTLLSNTTQLTPGTATANLGALEDGAQADGKTGVENLIGRQIELTNNTSADGDLQLPEGDLYGHQVTKDQQRHKRTYSTSFTVTPVASATDIFQLIGSASTTVEVTKITISGTQTTANDVVFTISKRSTANTGGSSSTATIVPHNSARAAATAVGTIYTANPTTGTPVGDIKTLAIPIGSATIPSQPFDIDFGVNDAAPWIIGVAQTLAIRLGGVTVTGGSLSISIEFTEF